LTRRPHAIVVGAGMTGLAAAYELATGGADVEVVDAAARPGGPILTTPLAGIDLDAGPDAFLARVPHAVELCEELGLGGELVAPATRLAYLWCDGRLRRFPDGLLLGIPTDLEALAASGIVSPAGVRRAAEDLERPADGPAAGCDESVGQLVRRRLGPEVLDRLVDPLLSGIFAGDTDQLSLLAGAPQIAAAARPGPSLLAGARAALEAATTGGATPGGAPPRSRPPPVFFTVRGGLGRLVTALVDAVGPARFRLDTTLHVLARRPGADRRFLLTGSIGSGGAVELDADGVVVATPAAAAAGLLGGLVPEAARLLTAIHYASVTLVSFAYRDEDVPMPLEGSGFLVPRSAGLLMTACSWASSKFDHLGGDGTTRLRVSAGRVDDRRAEALSDEALVAALRDDLTTTMGIEAAPREVRVNRWPASLPQYRVGHLDRLAVVEDEVRRHVPGVVVTGAAFRGVGLPACIDQGRRAARQVLSLFG
jgi:protoporphyrinogen/coproporphyrinogen III oxidase